MKALSASSSTILYLSSSTSFLRTFVRPVGRATDGGAGAVDGLGGGVAGGC